MGTILFFDDWPLCVMENVRRVIGRPRYVPEATLEDALTEEIYAIRGDFQMNFGWGRDKAPLCYQV